MLAARSPIRDRVVGAVEGALDIVAKVVGGGVGGIGGLWYGRADRKAKTTHLKRWLKGAQLGVGVVRDIYRQTRITNGRRAETEAVRIYWDLVDSGLKALPFGGGPRGTLVSRCRKGSQHRSAWRCEMWGARGDAAMEAATPRMSQRSMELVGKATDAGVPINFHQLSDNKFMKIIGETAENVPLAGGGSLRAKRREAFNWRWPSRWTRDRHYGAGRRLVQAAAGRSRRTHRRNFQQIPSAGGGLR